MAEEITITIHKDELGPAEEFGRSESDLKLVDDKGTARVKVFINNKLADAKATMESVVVKAPPRPVKASPRPQEDMLTVVVTTNQEKIIKVLKYDREKDYDPIEGTIRKPVGGRKSVGEPQDAGSASAEPQNAGSALIKAIGEAAQKIADAMAASKASSGASAAPSPSDAPGAPTATASTPPAASTPPGASSTPIESDKPRKTR